MTSSEKLPAEAEVVSEFDRDVESLMQAENRDPFRLLGPHIVEENEERRLVARGFFPGVSEAHVILNDQSNSIPAKRIRPEGLFEAALPVHPHLPIPANSYRWRVMAEGRPAQEFFDTYAFPPLLSDFDLYLMGEGTHYQKYEKMGAHPVVVDGVAGVMFAVSPVGSLKV